MVALTGFARAWREPRKRSSHSVRSQSTATASAGLRRRHGAASHRRPPDARARGLRAWLHARILVPVLALCAPNQLHPALDHLLHHLCGRHRADRLCLPQISNVEDAMNRHPILTILMAVAGVILLLPGVCAAGFMVLGGLHNPDPSIIGLWLVCLMVAAGGALLLYKAFQKPAPPTS